MDSFNKKNGPSMREVVSYYLDKPMNKIDLSFLNDKSNTKLTFSVKDDANGIYEIEGYESFNNKSSSCIDNITVYLKIDNNIVIDAKFSGFGCAVSTVSTDLLCRIIVNKTKEEVKLILDNYFKMISSEEYDESILDDLNAFQSVAEYAHRIKCALVGVNAISKIIEKK